MVQLPGKYWIFCDAFHPIPDGFFWGCSQMGGQKGPPSRKSVTHILQWKNILAKFADVSRTQRLCHKIHIFLDLLVRYNCAKFHHDETWHNYTSPKDPKIIWISWHNLLSSADISKFCYITKWLFWYMRSFSQLLIHNLYLFQLFLSL